MAIHQAQKVKVLPSVTGYLGHDVTLPCQFILGPSDTKDQLQWELQPPEGKKINIVVSHHKFGVNVSDSFLKGRVEIKEESLIIHKVEMRDEGSYTCSITAFPSGSLKGTTQLHVQGERIKISITPSQKPNLNTIFCFIFSNPTVPISGYIFYLSTNYQ